MFNVILQLSGITRALLLKTQMFWTSDGTEQAAYTGQSKYISTNTPKWIVLKDPSDRVAENRANLTAGIILREKEYF
jgi:hypothetical protein